MNRRKFITLSTAGVAGLALSGAAISNFRTFDLTLILQQLQSLQGQNIQSIGDWTAAQIFRHCAQSIQGSLSGFPEHKAALFQQTAGKLALFSFKAAGAMHHPLAEAIPGMARLDKNEDPQQALAVLLQTLDDFLSHINRGAALAPHFAYGVLNVADYQAAHWLHLHNHLSQIIVV